MSNNRKVYIIEVQMDSARQQLADAVAKLQELDAQLEGLDKESEAGKKLVAEMAAAAKAVQDLTGEVAGLGEELDALKPGTVGALEKQIEELERAWKRTTLGTKESEEALLALGNAKGQLKELEDRIDALDPSEQAAALVDFTNGIVGGFALASTAAQQWGGLSAESAAQVEQRLQSLLVVMSAFEAISKATSGETLTNVKNMYALAKSYLFGAESASTASKITRAALIATGIGAIVVLVGLLVANWDTFKTKFGGSEKLFNKVREVASGVFEGILAYLKNLGGVVMKLWDGDFSGAVAKAKNVGHEIAAGYAKGVQEVVDDENRKLLAKQIEAQERLLKVQQAGGFDTEKLQRQILTNKLAVLKQGTEEEKKAYAEAATDLAAFEAEQRKKHREEALASTAARLSSIAALEQAKGQESYRAQLNEKRQQLVGLLAAESQNDAAIIAKRGEIDALKAQHETQQAEKSRARFVQGQQEQLALLEKQGKDTLELRVKQAEELLAYDKAALQRREQRHEQASEKEIEQAHASHQALLLAQAEYNTKVREGVEANIAQRQDVEAQGREVDNAFAKAAGEAAQDAYVEALGKDAAKAGQGTNLGRFILTNFFGVKPEDVEKVKGQLNEAFASISQSVGGAVDAMLTSGISEAQAQIDAVQTRLGELDQQLSAASAARANTQSQLEAATGARKQYLLERLERERAAEAKIAAEKAKAAREEQEAQKIKAKLEKEQQQISAASTAIEAVLLGIKSAQVLVDIASKGKFGYDNIILAVTAAATLGAGIFAMKNAAKSFESGTGALGSDGVLRGPRHGQGGVGLFNNYGHFFGEAEGGEAITPVDASANNAAALELIRTKGRSRTLTLADFAQLGSEAGDIARSLAPTPSRYFEAGGLLNKGGVPGGQASAADVSALAAQQQRTNALLADVVAHLSTVSEGTTATADATATTASHTGTIKAYGPPVLAFGYEAEQKRRELADGLDQSESFATL